MYIDNIEDEVCREVFRGVQYDLMKTIQDAGYTWGIWIHAGVAGSFMEGCPGINGEITAFWQFNTNMPTELLKRTIRELEKEIWEAQRCGHDWDCCGCQILYGFEAFRDMYLGESYTFVEKWGINV